MLRPEAIETHGDPSSAIKIIGPDGDRLVAPGRDGDTTGSPVMLLVPPLSTRVVVETNRHAWVYRSVLIGFSELRIPHV